MVDHELSNAIRDIAALRNQERSRRSDAHDEASRRHELLDALTSAEFFNAPTGTPMPEFARLWAPCWIRSARAVRSTCGIDSIGSLVHSDAPGSNLAIDTFNRVLAGLSEEETAELLARRLVQLERIEGRDVPAANSRWAFRTVFFLLRDRLHLLVGQASEAIASARSGDVSGRPDSLPKELADLVPVLTSDSRKPAQIALALIQAQGHRITLKELRHRKLTSRASKVDNARDLRSVVNRAYPQLDPYLKAASRRGTEPELYLAIGEGDAGGAAGSSDCSPRSHPTRTSAQ